jgi:endoglycosylceramidase
LRGREVLLRGVNVNALARYWKGTRFRTVFPLGRRDPGRIAAMGWNTVRLLVSWSRVEPRPGRYDRDYLNTVAATVRRLARHRIYTIVDLHQDAWGASLAAPPGQPCTPPELPALGWDGAPRWATLDGGAPRCYPGTRELSPAVRAAWTAFFEDAAGPGGVGIQTRYLFMLRRVARRLARSTALAGIDVMNEPNAFGDQQAAQLSVFYRRALDAIRTGERAGRGRRHLVLFEPSALWSATGSGAPPDFEGRDRDVVYAPHIYSGGFSGGPIGRAAFAVAREEARRFGGAPVLSGEWGADPGRAGDPDDPYFIRHQNLQDSFRVSATLWTWRESCGDPHKVADLRAGRLPEVWGLFRVSCRDNRVRGPRRALAGQLTRAYVRAAPGRLRRTRYTSRGSLIASGTAPRRAGPLVAFFPLSPPTPPGGRDQYLPSDCVTARDCLRIRSRGLTGVRLVRGPGDSRYVVAHARGGRWSLSVGSRR